MIYQDPMDVCETAANFGVSKWKGLVLLKVGSVTRLDFLRLVSVSVCLCAFTVLSAPQYAMLTWAESAETECPCQEEGERSGEERVVCASARHRTDDRRHHDVRRPHKADHRFSPTAPCSRRLPAIIGHQLANGLCAPLLI
jgi:hypothetical protein